MVDFPGRRNERFSEDPDLLMCEMKARMQSEKPQGGKGRSQMFTSLFSAGEKEV